ncbi:MAG: acyltransferase [Sphingobacteriaceae bacterium]|nr:acyltransferase [Sphingobacteriaceae bacterium]
MGKLNFVEGARGFAALIVVFQHLALIFYPTLYTGDSVTAHYSPDLEFFLATTPFNIFYNGNFAVCVFFVLSGFVLSNKYFLNPSISILIDYSLKRYFRLLIPAAFSAIFAFLMLYVFKPDFFITESVTNAGPWLKGLFADKPGCFDFVYTMFIDVFINGNNKYNPVLWTMGVEFLGSLLLFAVLALTHVIVNKNKMFILIISVLFIFKLHFYAAFFIGSLICYNYQKSDKSLNKFVTLSLLIIGVYFASYPTSWQYMNQSIYKPFLWLQMDFMNYALVIGSGILFYLLTKSILFQKLLSNAFFKLLGKISFSMYLIHLVILITVTRYLFHYFLLSHSYNISCLIACSISIPIIFLCAYIVYLFIDKPSISISNYLGKRLSEIINT